MTMGVSALRRHIGTRIAEEDVATAAPLKAIVATFDRQEEASRSRPVGTLATSCRHRLSPGGKSGREKRHTPAPGGALRPALAAHDRRRTGGAVPLLGADRLSAPHRP